MDTQTVRTLSFRTFLATISAMVQTAEIRAAATKAYQQPNSASPVRNLSRNTGIRLDFRTLAFSPLEIRTLLLEMAPYHGARLELKSGEVMFATVEQLSLRDEVFVRDATGDARHLAFRDLSAITPIGEIVRVASFAEVFERGLDKEARVRFGPRRYEDGGFRLLRDDRRRLGLLKDDRYLAAAGVASIEQLVAYGGPKILAVPEGDKPTQVVLEVLPGIDLGEFLRANKAGVPLPFPILPQHIAKLERIVTTLNRRRLHVSEFNFGDLILNGLGDVFLTDLMLQTGEERHAGLGYLQYEQSDGAEVEPARWIDESTPLYIRPAVGLLRELADYQPTRMQLR